MKKKCLFILVFFVVQRLHAQNYIPLKIDSLYSYHWEMGFELDTIVIENRVGYSYDANDSLIQLRYPTQRYNYTYSPDTSWILTEILNNNTWSPYSISKTAFSNGKIVSQLIQSYLNNSWTNSALISFSYNAAQQQTYLVQQLWSNNAWQNFYKSERTYNSEGYNTEQAEYYANTNGVWEYNRGQRYKYDNAGHQIEVIYINSAVTGTYFTSRTNWSYGNDNLVDSIQNCQYNYPNNGICNPVSLTTNDYSTPGNTQIKTYLQENNSWSIKAKEVVFDGPAIYSSRPDSILYFSFQPSTQTYSPSDRHYLQYQELSNGTIYFREENYTYFGEPIGWLRTLIVEEWYHLTEPVGVNQPSEKDKSVVVSPNPCKPATQLNIKSLVCDKVMIFDELGRLVASLNTAESSAVRAPIKCGVYTLVLMQNGKLVGRSKQIVAE